MTRIFNASIAGFALVLWACAGLAAEGTLSPLAQAKAQAQQNPDKHILVFYKNYRS